MGVCLKRLMKVCVVCRAKGIVKLWITRIERFVRDKYFYFFERCAVLLLIKISLEKKVHFK